MKQTILSYAVRILVIFLKWAAIVAMGTVNAHKFTYGGF